MCPATEGPLAYLVIRELRYGRNSEIRVRFLVGEVVIQFPSLNENRVTDLTPPT
jgi:hypothetical protein